MKLLNLVFAFGACLLLAACGGLTDNIVVAQNQDIGISTAQKPDGSIGFDLGWSQFNVASIPLNKKDQNGNYTATKSNGPCGRNDAVSALASLSGNTNAAPPGASGTTVTVNLGQVAASGPAAYLVPMAALQQANPNVDVLKSWEECSHATPPAPTSASLTAGPAQ